MKKAGNKKLEGSPADPTELTASQLPGVIPPALTVPAAHAQRAKSV